MNIAIPRASLGGRTEVNSMMKRWVASPKTPMETIEVASEDLCILRDSPRLDPGEFTISRLPAFERELVKTVPKKGVEHVTQTILQLLEANGDPWWAPYLFESYAELIYRPVADRLFENSCRHWEFVKGLGKIFLYGVERTGCEEMGFPFIGYGTLEDGVPVKRKVPLV